MLGSDSALYWSCNAFIPQYLLHTGRAGLVAPALVALNAGQVPAGLVIALLPRMVVRRSAYWIPGLLCIAGVLALGLGPGWPPGPAAAALGFFAGWIFVLALALPPLLAEPGDVARLAAAMYTITYVCSFLAPVLGGTAWDHTGRPPFAFAPALVATVALTLLAAGLRLPRHATAPVAVAPA